MDIDPDMIARLRGRFGSQKNVTVVQSDIMEFDLNSLKGTWKVVGNLPYNLTSPILRKLTNWNAWQEAHVMVQKEVAERICAKVGTPEYSALTVGMNLIAKPTFVFELSETSFSPPPRVKSAVVLLDAPSDAADRRRAGRAARHSSGVSTAAENVVELVVARTRRRQETSLRNGLRIWGSR